MPYLRTRADQLPTAACAGGDHDRAVVHIACAQVLELRPRVELPEPKARCGDVLTLPEMRDDEVVRVAKGLLACPT